jgi:16S rRNA (cytosine967-C5)-methyltransferase
VSPARWAAFQILGEVESTDAHSDDLLHGKAVESLSPLDRNLATALVMGVLRWQIALDAELRQLLARPDDELILPIQMALRLGAFQLRHMDRIPAHAALSESVEMVRAAGHPKAAGLVNAVLRKFSTQAPPGKPIVESLDAMAVRLGHPAWMVRRWTAAYGRQAAQAICEYDQHEPSPGTLFVREDAAESVEPLVREGGTRLMDDGSRLVAELAAVSQPAAGRIWDACAAPGGKAAVLAERHPGAELLASDIGGRRTEAMRRRLEHELPGHTIRTLTADATKLPATEGSFDLILCDVPCSGTGTLARNPEIRRRLQAPDLARQSARQVQILTAALARLRPGGRLIYSTCSLEPEENERVVEAALAARSGVGRLPSAALVELIEELKRRTIVRAEREDLSGLVRDDALRTLPGANFAGDGFFAVVLVRET